ncbi:hypothetical protein I7I48_07588 [Histoplasma ohiense]|nr:hypothetical protein I7I48_07588 [Histoplasma ohiense (nom. inval.)]
MLMALHHLTQTAHKIEIVHTIHLIKPWVLCSLERNGHIPSPNSRNAPLLPLVHSNPYRPLHYPRRPPPSNSERDPIAKPPPNRRLYIWGPGDPLGPDDGAREYVPTVVAARSV